MANQEAVNDAKIKTLDALTRLIEIGIELAGTALAELKAGEELRRTMETDKAAGGKGLHK